jgi:hypothetical protein
VKTRQRFGHGSASGKSSACIAVVQVKVGLVRHHEGRAVVAPIAAPAIGAGSAKPRGLTPVGQ